MKGVLECPICKNKDCKEIFKKEFKCPEGNLKDNQADFNFVRNYILFEKILQWKDPIKVSFKICANCGFIFFSPRCEEKDYAIKFDVINNQRTDILNEKETYSKTYDDKKAFLIFKGLTELRKIENSTIIDIGGARGLYLKYFLPNNRCYVVDYVKHDLMSGVTYLCKSSQEIPEAIKADVVLFCHTLEHVLEPVREILNIKNILKPGGLLYIEVPPGCWQQEYKKLGNLITHINFFSEGSLWYLLNMCGLKIKYLKLKPLIGRTRYEPIIMTIAENATPGNIEVDGYQITCKQMRGNHLLIRLYTNFMSLKLMKLKYFLWLLKRIKFVQLIKLLPSAFLSFIY